MKRLLKALGLLLGISAPVLAGVSGPPAGNYIVDYGTTTSQHIFNVTSGTVSGEFYNNALTNGQCVQAGTGGLLTSAGFACGSGGGGGSSSLAISAGVFRSSPTTDAIFPATQFVGTVSGSSMTVTLNPSSVTLQGQNVAPASGSTNYIQNSNSLQSGATFYVSSGTVQGPLIVQSIPAGASNPSTGTITMSLSNSSFGTNAMNVLVNNPSEAQTFSINFSTGPSASNYDQLNFKGPGNFPAGIEANGVYFSTAQVIFQTSVGSYVGIQGSTLASSGNPVWKLPNADSAGLMQSDGSLGLSISTNVTDASGLGITYGVTAGSLTLTGSGWPNFIPSDGNTYNFNGSSSTPVTVGHTLVYTSTSGATGDSGSGPSGGGSFIGIGASGSALLTSSATLVGGTNTTLSQSGSSITINSVPAGSSTQFQYNASGAFAGSADIIQQSAGNISISSVTVSTMNVTHSSVFSNVTAMQLVGFSSMTFPSGTTLDTSQGLTTLGNTVISSSQTFNALPITGISLTSCGTGSPTVSGSNVAGTITLGGGSPTACTLNFSASAFVNTPVCVCSPNAGVSCGVSSSSASSVTFALSVTETKINYICIGSD